MSQRICQLEDALAITHASLSSDRHSLLQPELVHSKYGLGRDPKSQVTAVTEAFGTLAVEESGDSKYFGSSAGSEVCTFECVFFWLGTCTEFLLNRRSFWQVGQILVYSLLTRL